MNTVSVHLVTYNSAKDISACLTAVLKQTYPIEQIIVIDNDSRDETLEKLHAFQDNIQLVVNKVNNGFAGAHNQAIQLSNCHYQLVLNPDVILHPDYVRILMEFASTHPDAGSLCGLLLSKSGLGRVDSTGLEMKRNRRVFDRGQGEDVAGYLVMAEVFGVSGAAALYSREMIAAISDKGQFFDEAFFAYKEDIDVAWRARWAGWKAYYLPGATALHERGWKSGGRVDRAYTTRKHSFENRYRMLIKNDRLSNILLHLPYILAYEVMQFGYIVLKERDMLPSYWRIMRMWPDLLQQRKQILGNAKANKKEIYSFFH